MEFSEVISKRHSVRRFTGEAVPRFVIDGIIDEAQTAPSSKNTRSTAFMVIEDADTLVALSEARESGSALIKGAAAAIIVLGDESKTDLWRENCSISATFLQLSAVDKGLGSCWVHIFERKRSKNQDDKSLAEDYVRNLLGVREGMRIHCIVALGYEAPIDNC